jgi:hypothetical protein
VRDVVVFPHASAAILAHLAEALDVPTDDSVPLDRKPGDGPLIIAIRVGGIATDIVLDQATVVVEYWHDTEDEAHDLAQLGRAYLLAMWNTVVDGTLIYRVIEAGGPASLPDPLQRSPRYTATYTVHVRGSALVESV